MIIWKLMYRLRYSSKMYPFTSFRNLTNCVGRASAGSFFPWQIIKEPRKVISHFTVLKSHLPLDSDGLVVYCCSSTEHVLRTCNRNIVEVPSFKP